MAAIWPIDWPPSINITTYDQFHVARAEDAAARTLRMLTLYRVGGLPITVMPCPATCCQPFTGGQFGYSYLPFHPILLESGKYANCFCGAGCSCTAAPSVMLTAPVGRIDEVKVDGIVLPASAYRVEDGNRLVRLDGKGWPACSGTNFTVTYLNAIPVDVYGQFVGGLLAREFLLLFTNPQQCRLPSGVTAVSRQGLSYEIERGVFAEGVTNIPEVDLYVRQWNPYAMKLRPEVYSPDMPTQHEITGGI